MSAGTDGQPRVTVECESCNGAPASQVVRFPVDAAGVAAVFLVCAMCAMVADNSGLSR